MYDYINNLLGEPVHKTKNKSPVSVDGSHYSLDKLLMKDNVPSYNKGKTTQLTITTILNLDNKLPLYINENTNNDEIQGFLDELQNITEKYVFIFDRLYFSEKIVRLIKNKECDGIFRLQNKLKFVKQFIASGKEETIINIFNNKKVTRGTKNSIDKTYTIHGRR